MESTFLIFLYFISIESFSGDMASVAGDRPEVDAAPVLAKISPNDRFNLVLSTVNEDIGRASGLLCNIVSVIYKGQKSKMRVREYVDLPVRCMHQDSLHHLQIT